MNTDLEKLLVAFEKSAQILEKPGYDPYIKSIAMECANKMIEHLTQITHKEMSAEVYNLSSVIMNWADNNINWKDENSSGYADEVK